MTKQNLIFNKAQNTKWVLKFADKNLLKPISSIIEQLLRFISFEKSPGRNIYFIDNIQELID